MSAYQKYFAMASLVFLLFLFAGCIFDNNPPPNNVISSGNDSNTIIVEGTLENITFENNTAPNMLIQNDSFANASEQANATENANAQANQTGLNAQNNSASGANETENASRQANVTENAQANETGANKQANATENASAQANETIAPPEFKISGSAKLDSNFGRMGNNRCKISAKTPTIKQGSTSGVEIYAYSPNEEVTFLCGDEMRIQGRNGLFQDERVCTFSTPGLQSIWIALDGEICATAPVRVYNGISQYESVCQVLDETAASKASGLSKDYSASVYIANYGKNSTISWSCGEEKFSRQLYTLLYGETVSGVLRLSCNFSIDSGYRERIPVYIGAHYCGDLAFGS